MQPTRLETAILRWYVANFDDPDLVAQAASATVKNRRHHGSGYFVKLCVPEDVPRIADMIDDINPIPGPWLSSEELSAGAEAVLWVEDGTLESLEVFSSGPEFPEYLEKFELIDPRTHGT